MSVGRQRAMVRQRQKAALIAEKLREFRPEPLVYLDVSSAGNPDVGWQHLIDSGAVNAYHIDMVDVWSREKRSGQAGITFVKAALGGQKGPATAYITRHPACSSCLRPNGRILGKYPVSEWFEVVREESVILVDYESLSRERDLPQPEIVKIDVQGLEGQVIDGMGAALDGILCLEFECQLQALYEGQETFDQLYQKLISKGFMLCDMKPQGPFEGEAIEFNAFWSRRPENEVQRLTIELWKTANSVWEGSRFSSADPKQRAAYHFND